MREGKGPWGEETETDLPFPLRGKVFGRRVKESSGLPWVEGVTLSSGQAGGVGDTAALDLPGPPPTLCKEPLSACQAFR